MNTDNSHDTLAVSQGEQDPQTRNRLLESAVHIFDRKGYSAASVREIAEMAGVTKPALYYHFGSKEGLLIAILDEAVREFGKAIRLAGARTGTARDRLVALCDDVFCLFEQNIPLVRVAKTVFLGPADIAPAFDLTMFQRTWREALQQVVEDGQRAGEFRPGRSVDVAYALMGLVDSCLQQQMHAGLDPVGRDGLLRIITLLFEGVASQQRPVATTVEA
ncbi:MAG: TetR/AcrR family transcriptional regulator [Acidobacteriota bacterium]